MRTSKKQAALGQKALQKAIPPAASFRRSNNDTANGIARAIKQVKQSIQGIGGEGAGEKREEDGMPMTEEGDGRSDEAREGTGGRTALQTHLSARVLPEVFCPPKCGRVCLSSSEWRWRALEEGAMWLETQFSQQASQGKTQLRRANGRHCLEV
jgi:hypothetical protein